MSETEKKQRAEYQQHRTRQIYIRSIILVVLAAAVLLSGVYAGRLSRNAYVTYTESGSADYQVYINENKFYSEEYLDKDHAYISMLTDQIHAQLSYTMQAASRAEYTYSYYVDARLRVQDADSNAPLFDPVQTLVEPQSGTSTERTLKIEQAVQLDYQQYDTLAREFVQTYQLDNPRCDLLVTLHVNVDGTCPNVTADQGNYEVSLTIPLNKTTLKIETNTSVPQAEAKVMACSKEGAVLMGILCAALGAVLAVWAVWLVVYIVRTRDRHINYSRQVKKILSSYKSYIQCIKDPLDTAGCQVLRVESFTELLEIRDTVQMPILMHEDEDRTCARFTIPSGAGFIYAYEVTVAGVPETV